PRASKFSSSRESRIFGSTCIFSAACRTVYPLRSRAARRRAPIPVRVSPPDCPPMMSARIAIELGEPSSLIGAGEIHPQLTREFRGGDLVALRARDPDAYEQQIRRCIECTEILVELRAGVNEIALHEIQLDELEYPFRIARAQRERPFELLGRQLVALRLAQAHPGVGVGNFRSAIKLVGGNVLEQLDALVRAPRAAQVYGVAVLDVGIFAVQAQRLAELVIRLLRLVEAIEQQRAGGMHRRKARILIERLVELFLGNLEIALIHVSNAELDVVAGGIVLTHR